MISGGIEVINLVKFVQYQNQNLRDDSLLLWYIHCAGLVSIFCNLHFHMNFETRVYKHYHKIFNIHHTHSYIQTILKNLCDYTVNYFCKQIQSQMFYQVLTTSLYRKKTTSPTLVPKLKKMEIHLEKRALCNFPVSG